MISLEANKAILYVQRRNTQEGEKETKAEEIIIKKADLWVGFCLDDCVKAIRLCRRLEEMSPDLFLRKPSRRHVRTHWPFRQQHRHVRSDHGSA